MTDIRGKLKAVFDNAGDTTKRFGPKATSDAGGWLVYDYREQRWVPDFELKAIDPFEPRSAS